MRTAFILAVRGAHGDLGEISLTHAMKQIGEVREFSPAAIYRVLLRSLRQVWLWIAVGLMALSFYAFLTMLSWYPVSFVVPATSLAYVAGALGAKFLLRERLSATRWAGRDLHLLRGGAGVGGSNAGVAARRGCFSRCCATSYLWPPLAPLAFYLFSAWAAWRFFRASRHRATAAERRLHFRPVSILKPLKGLDRGAYENFASFCRQEYPQYEILFAVSDEERSRGSGGAAADARFPGSLHPAGGGRRNAREPTTK